MIVSVILFLLITRAVAQSPPVKIWLTTPWNHSSPILETFEFLAQEGVDLLQVLEDSSWKDKTSWQDCRDLAEKYLDKSLWHLHEYALQHRVMVPQVHVHHELSMKLPECDVVFEWNGKHACDFDVVNLDNPSSEEAVLPFDHVLTIGKVPLIVYADIQSKNYNSLHGKILEFVEKNQLSYVLRHKVPRETQSLTLPGYGVELWIKKTDYKVVDDRRIQFQADQGLVAVDDEGEAELTDLTQGESPRIAPLEKNQTIDLGVKASHYILHHPDPLNALVHLSQNFPTYAHHLANQPSQPALLQALESQQMEIPNPRTHPRAPPQTSQGVWINGLPLDLTNLNPFGLLRLLRTEQRVIQSLHDLGFSSQEAISILTSSSGDYRGSNNAESFDVRDENVLIWFNNLEKDKRYSRWPESMQEILRPNFMMGNPLKVIRRNIFNTLFVLDLSHPRDLQAFDFLLMFIQREIPLHLALVPLVDADPNQASSIIAKLTKFFSSNFGLKDARDYVSSVKLGLQSGVSMTEAAKIAFDQLKNRKPRAELETPPPKEYQAALDSMNDYYNKALAWRQRLGIEEGSLFMNGRMFAFDDMWQQSLMQIYVQQLEFLQRKIQGGEITADNLPKDWLDWWCTLPGVLRRRNPWIKDDLKTAWDIGLDEARSIPYVVEQDNVITTVWLVTDFRDSTLGKLSMEWAKDKALRLAWIQNPVVRVKFGDVDSNLDIASKEIPRIRQDLDEDQTAIVVNGVVCGPFPKDFELTLDDFDACLSLGQSVGDGLVKAFEKLGKSPDADLILAASAIVARDASAKELEDGIVSGEKHRTTHGVEQAAETKIFLGWDGSKHVPGVKTNPMFDIYALLDPVSPQTQRTSAILQHVLNVFKDQVGLTLGMNPPLTLEDVPIKRYYRYVQPRLGNDSPAEQPHATFSHLPTDVLLSCSDLDTPRAWLTMPLISIHDLDNIKLDDLVVPGGVEAVFTLKQILVEGHALDQAKQPPRGLQLELKRGDDVVHDTIVMANFGYFQLQAPSPGMYTLDIRKGRSKKVAQMVYVGEDLHGLMGTGAADNVLLPVEEDPPVLLISHSFEGLTIFVKVEKKKGMETVDFLDDGEKQEKSSLWNQIKDNLGLGKKGQADINIFSVASGHLYERFMSIMFLSVMKHTKATVKFWLIENFMSPSFKQFLPKLAQHYGFQYELVTYKWPHWLRAQTEKQRTIWAYKILFLDVLFPLQLDRVIFVDADQIVRVDMKELADMDIKGAAYAYTPFCDSRTETEGYRFWKQGYWLNHLQGRPYHISALYLVDLVRFRGIAAGDRLRAQYQMLSADPESLANLDQDLPNSMMDQVPMFSLPQEWLWCETWCSDESLAKAKTIDLCNNPMTKEPKLDRAKRQVKEWTALDDEVQAFAESLKQKPTEGIKDEL